MVRLINTATGITRENVTDEGGHFSFPNSLPAVYDLTVSAVGFKTSVRRGIQLQVDQLLRVDVELELGEIQQQIEINAQAPLIESESAKVGTVVETRQITELPLNGRQFAQLILLTPGALPIALGQSTSFKVQLGAGSYSPVINGQRSRFNSFTLDGVENNDPMFNSYAINPSVDAIQEFSVQSRGDADDLGRSMGSDVVVVTRSGTNQYHGAAWEFLRNTDLDARNFFDPQRPNFKQNQFGGTFGGPVRLPHYKGQQRTFFFGYFEGFRYVRSANNIATVPTDAMRTGDFSAASLPRLYDIATTRPDSSSPAGYVRDPFPGNIIPQGRLNSSAADLLKQVYPSPNLPGTTLNYINTTPQRQRSDQESVRVDHKISDNNTLFARFSYSNGYNSNPGGIPSVSTKVTNIATNATLSDSHIFRPNLIGHFQFGFSRYTSNQTAASLPDSILKETGWDQVFPSAAPYYLLLGLNVTDASGAGGAFIPIGPHDLYQSIGDITWNHGRHAVKAGLTWNYLDSFQASPQASIGFTRRPTSNLVDQNATGYGVATFLLGLPTDARRAGGDTSALLSHNEYHFFLQDEIRLTSRLTLTAGLRYSYVQAMKEARNAYSGLDVQTGNYLLAVNDPTTGAGPNLRERWVDPQWNNFAPRVGLAWMLDSKTSVRAGAGIYYSYTDYVQYFADPAGQWPFGFSETVGPLNDFFVDSKLSNPFTGSAGVQIPTSPKGQGGYSINPRVKIPYSIQRSFSIQRELPFAMLVDASYVGSNSVKLLQSRNENQALPGPGPVQARRPLPDYGVVIWDDNGPPSNYNGLSLRLQKRFSAGLSILTSYTWSHNLDIYSTERGGNNGGVENPLNWRADYATSSANMTNVFLWNGIYELPFGRGKSHLNHGLLATIAGNWEWSNILSLYSGQPVNVALGFDNASTGTAGGQRPNLVGNPYLSNQSRLRWFNTAAFAAPAPMTFGNAGRNILRGPALRNYDTAVMKNFVISEHKRLQFRTEFFNAFNIVNFNNPNGTFNSPNFGIITAARPSRSIQFSLKLLF
jgi:hypothetical protein